MTLQPLISCTYHLGSGLLLGVWYALGHPWEAKFSVSKDIIELFLEYF